MQRNKAMICRATSVFVFFLVVLSYATEDYKAIIEKMNKVMANTTMTYTEHIGSGKSPTLVNYKQIRHRDGTVSRVGILNIFKPLESTPRREMTGRMHIRKDLFTSAGRTEIFMYSEKTYGIRTKERIPDAEKIYENGVFTGEEIEYEGSPCWKIHQRFQGKRNDEYISECIVQKKTFVKVADRLIDGGTGRVMMSARYTDFNFAPVFQENTFAIPSDTVLLFAKDVYEAMELDKKIIAEFTEWLDKNSPSRGDDPRRFRNRVKAWLYKAKVAPLEVATDCARVIGVLVAIGCAGGVIYLKIKK